MSEPTCGSTCTAPWGIGTPSSSAWPLVGKARPSSIRMVVVLPEPFGPRKPYTEPRGTARSMWSTATWPPRNRLVRPLVDTASAWPVPAADMTAGDVPGEVSGPVAVRWGTVLAGAPGSVAAPGAPAGPGETPRTSVTWCWRRTCATGRAGPQPDTGRPG